MANFSDREVPMIGYARTFDELFGPVVYHDAVAEGLGASVRVNDEGELTVVANVLANPWQIVGLGRGRDTDSALGSLIAGFEDDAGYVGNVARWGKLAEGEDYAGAVDQALSLVRGRVASALFGRRRQDFMDSLTDFLHEWAEGTEWE